MGEGGFPASLKLRRGFSVALAKENIQVFGTSTSLSADGEPALSLVEGRVEPPASPPPYNFLRRISLWLRRNEVDILLRPPCRTAWRDYGETSKLEERRRAPRKREGVWPRGE